MASDDEFFDLVALAIAYWQTTGANIKYEDLSKLDAEIDNLYQAIYFGLHHPLLSHDAIELLISLFQFVERRGHWHDWLTLIVQAQALTSTRPIVFAQLCNQAGILCRLQYNYAQAIEYHQRAIHVFSQHHRKLELAVTHTYLANAHYRARHFAESTQHNQQARHIFAQLSEAPPNQYLVSMENMSGLTLMETGDSQQAISAFKNALSVGHANMDTRYRATILNNLGIAYDRSGRISDALVVFDNALTILSDSEDEFTKTQTLLNKGTTLAKIGAWREAEHCFLQANSDFLSNSPDLRHKAMVANNLGYVLTQQKRFDESIVHFQHAIRQWRLIEDWLELSNSLGDLGFVWLQLDDTQKSGQAFDEAKQCLARCPSTSRASQIAEELAQRRLELVEKMQQERSLPAA